MDQDIKYISSVVVLVYYFILFPTVVCLKYNCINKPSIVVHYLLFCPKASISVYICVKSEVST
jgi:hypothetical protein